MLANVGELPSELVDGLKAAADAGKGVLVAVGDNLPADLATFLPGLLRTLGASANFTYLRTHGVFAGTTYLTSNQVAGFIPQTGNVNLSWRYAAWGVRVRSNYHGRYINSFSAATPARNQYRYARTVTDLGFTWQWRPDVQVFWDISNLTNEPQAFYRFIPSQMERTIINGTTWTLGISGRF